MSVKSGKIAAKENEPSKQPREYAVLYPCEDMMDAISAHIVRTEKYPHQWNITDIEVFNLEHKNDIGIYALPPHEDAFSNDSAIQKMDYLLPSIEQMLAEGVITFPENNIQTKTESKPSKIQFLSQGQIYPSVIL